MNNQNDRRFSEKVDNILEHNKFFELGSPLETYKTDIYTLIIAQSLLSLIETSDKVLHEKVPQNITQNRVQEI